MKFNEKELDIILKSLRYQLHDIEKDISGCEYFFEERGFENCQEIQDIYFFMLKEYGNLKKLIDKIENV